MGKWNLHLLAGTLLLSVITTLGAPVSWRHLSSAQGDLPAPSPQGVAMAIVTGDFNHDTNSDFIIGLRQTSPALVLYHRGTNFNRLPIEAEALPIGRGGTALDIDSDGDLDVVFGSDTGPELWWWENPFPRLDPNRSWARHLIRNKGGGPVRGQLFADLEGTSHLQLVFWNQASNAVFLARVPDDPRTHGAWDLTRIFSPPGATIPGSWTSLASADINIDGNADLLASNFWLRRTNALQFEATPIGNAGGRSAIGRFRESTYPQIVVAPEGKPGLLFWYECVSNPGLPGSWAGRQLLREEVFPAATLAIADLDQDGNDDIFFAEARPFGSDRGAQARSPGAWMFYSDGHGNFRTEPVQAADEINEGKFLDLDGDGDLDLISTHRNVIDIRLNQAGPQRNPVYPK